MAIKASGAVALTWDALQGLPDDGYRRELVHGQLLVTPSPSGRHQRAVARLGHALASACPTDLEVLHAPYDWKLSDTMVFQPDLMVTRTADFSPDGPFSAIPLLVVEVLSPSTKDTDMSLKRLEYERAGVPGYWLVDPDVPSLLVLELADVAYRQVVEVHGDGAYRTERPFAVSIVPARLID